MQDITQEDKSEAVFKMKDLSPEDKARLVGVFAWLIAEDKRQNPALYQIKQTQND
jgi:hypothetical protein